MKMSKLYEFYLLSVQNKILFTANRLVFFKNSNYRCTCAIADLIVHIEEDF